MTNQSFDRRLVKRGREADLRLLNICAYEALFKNSTPETQRMQLDRNRTHFQSGDCAAWFGLTPKWNSSDGEDRPGKISQHKRRLPAH